MGPLESIETFEEKQLTGAFIIRSLDSYMMYRKHGRMNRFEPNMRLSQSVKDDGHKYQYQALNRIKIIL